MLGWQLYYNVSKYHTNRLWGQIQPLHPDIDLNLRERVLGEVEKNRFIALQVMATVS